jgi:hypothetical protein
MTFVAVEVAMAAETAAAIAAAEMATAAAAAETAAAVTAAEIAAAEAATAAAAAETTAATTAATEAATAVPEATGILEANAGATPLPPATTPTPAGLEQAPIAGSTPPPPTAPPPPAGATPPPAGIEQASAAPDLGTMSSEPSSLSSELETMANNPAYDNVVADGTTSTPTGPQTQAEMPGEAEGVLDTSTNPRQVGNGIPLQTAEEVAYNAPFEPASTPPGNPFLDGVKSIGQFIKENKTETAIGSYFAANALGMFKPTSSGLPEKKKYPNPNPLSANFNSNAQTTPNVYRPMTYEEGGITQAASMDGSGDDLGQGGIANIPRYYRGELATSRGQKGDVYGATQRFLDMYDPASRYTPPAGASNPDVGIFRDTNPSTSSKSALEAADIRRKAIENRSYVKTGANYMPPSRDMGQLDFTIIGSKDKKNKGSDSDPVLAASGGIMQANLGGYAAGGNPRLLRGPGDGMSDNIPAVIGNKQPARLADGEFVVPADVVSHLGNGSTEAGAKRLHEMMNQVRMDRTGRKKQAPAVKAKKYIPK